MKWHSALDRVRAYAGALDRDGAIGRALVLASDRDLNLDLASALEIARTLAGALDLDLARALDQARALAGELVGNLAAAVVSDRALDRDRALSRAAMTARALASALDLALSNTLGGDHAPDRTAAPDLDLSRDLASALASYHDLLRALASYPALDRDRDLTGDFARYRDLAQDLARHLDRHSTTPLASVTGARSVPGRGPLALVMLAVRLLPRSWQPRYREEFRAELARLSPGERYEYARRVLAAGWKLRRTLAGTQCPPDGARAEG